MTTSLYQVDAFTSEPFLGNPAAIVVLSETRSDNWMLAFAQEMNLSETAFLIKRSDKFSLRWFTPKKEVALCGHATLASAHILFEKQYILKSEKAVFETKSGELTAILKDGWIELDFPSLTISQIQVTCRIKTALGFEAEKLFESDNNLLVQLNTLGDVRAYQPDFEKISSLPYQGLIITAQEIGTKFDFVSRYFAPRIGINEDPVTGSVHCSLAPYWASILKKRSFTAYQASNRGGVLKLKLDGERVKIQGQAQTIFSGTLEV